VNSRPRLLRRPGFTQSIRFRLTVLYSTLLFALAAVVLGGIYVAVERSTGAKPITTYQAGKFVQKPSGEIFYKGTIPVADVREVEQNVNYQTLQTLRRYSLWTLGGLFGASLLLGWALSGRALRPVRSITRTAEEIQATDLSRRINLAGPHDELRCLADTVDSMLDRLDGAFRAQRQIIDDASHELRSPLAIIRTSVDAVLSSPEATEAERRRAASAVDRATTRMTRLVEDLLATARRAAPAFVDTDVDLAAVARDAGEEFTPLVTARGLKIRYELRDGLTMIGDRDALRRAVGNLLSNAARLAPPGTDVTVAADRLDDFLWVAVSDAGPGIPAPQQTRVFDRFWRAGETRGGRERHSGLGLAIVRQIVEAHGGQVRLFSGVGAGSTFVLWLPAVHAEGRADAVPQVNPMLVSPEPSR